MNRPNRQCPKCGITISGERSYCEAHTLKPFAQYQEKDRPSSSKRGGKAVRWTPRIKEITMGDLK